MTGSVFRRAISHACLDSFSQRVKALEGELGSITANINSQMASKDELIKQLQDQVTLWRNKYEALAKLYSQLRTEHLDMLSKSKQLQLKANSAQEAIDRMERMERGENAGPDWLAFSEEVATNMDEGWNVSWGSLKTRRLRFLIFRCRLGELQKFFVQPL